MSQDDSSARELAEMKAYLEKRIVQLQEDLSRTTSIVKLVDSALADKSFKRMQIPSSTAASVTTEDSIARTEAEITSVVADDGSHLGEMQIADADLIIIPSQGMHFDVNSPPFKTFLVGRILDPMSTKDSQAGKTESCLPGNRIFYELETDGTNLKKLVVHNYGDERRLQELRNAIRWTLRTIYEKKSTS